MDSLDRAFLQAFLMACKREKLGYREIISFVGGEWSEMIGDVGDVRDECGCSGKGGHGESEEQNEN